MRGKVKFFLVKRGFGFITNDQGKDAYFHYTALQSGYLVKEDDRVEYDEMQTPKGLRAENIKVLGTD